MHHILLRHTYVVISLQLFSLIGSSGRTDGQGESSDPPSNSIGRGYKNSI